MTSSDSSRSFEASHQRYPREEKRRRKEIERQLKEEAKLSEREKAKLEVDAFENEVQGLLSVHKEQGPTWDWGAVAASLPPPKPLNQGRNETEARLEHASMAMWKRCVSK